MLYVHHFRRTLSLSTLHCKSIALSGSLGLAVLLRAGPFLRIPPFSPGFGIHHINEARAEADMDGLFRLDRKTGEVTGPVFLLFMRWWAFRASQHWSMGE